jgi:hypothetical protein
VRSDDLLVRGWPFYSNAIAIFSHFSLFVIFAENFIFQTVNADLARLLCVAVNKEIEAEGAGDSTSRRCSAAGSESKTKVGARKKRLRRSFSTSNHKTSHATCSLLILLTSNASRKGEKPFGVPRRVVQLLKRSNRDRSNKQASEIRRGTREKERVSDASNQPNHLFFTSGLILGHLHFARVKKDEDWQLANQHKLLPLFHVFLFIFHLFCLFILFCSSFFEATNNHFEFE